MAALDSVTDSATRAVLGELCALFLLEAVAPRTGELLADGRMSAEQVRALPDTVERLTAALAPHLTALAEACDVPEEHLSGLPLLSVPDPVTRRTG
ncbi:acyl-CoA dehydrogenase [Streptomyces sp. SAJ15]|uniref:acyl-CoA dehydrogenase n=1 Tax=Streptomyces sp. SAJ15 TaxID=2011095 RepID=UPI0021B1A6A7|nr:acyl-CoA dehydrogenase [Streptomyces sp. SAJ15]